ncbi:MAG TPA: hypothetical protein VF487_13765 [Chitinophagaceae bacterium]
MCYSQKKQKEAIKEKILGQLKEEELEIISLNDQNIHWEEEGKEFFLNGEMYDVVITKTMDGKVMLYCINDKKEKSLIDNYNLNTKNNSSPDKKSKRGFGNSFNLFLNNTERASTLNVAFIVTSFHSFDSQLCDNMAERISPPPKA